MDTQNDCFGREEHDRHEFNARFDEPRERWAGSAPDPEIEARYNDLDAEEDWKRMTPQERQHEELKWAHMNALQENKQRDYRKRLEDDPIPF